MEKRNNVLVISDLHLPYEHKNSLEHCKYVYKEYKCNHIVMIGDLVDNSSTSRWFPNPDMQSPNDELKEVIKKLKEWKKTFKNVIVTTGNHETRVFKKMQRNMITSKWAKSYAEVLEIPNWTFVNEYILNRVRYFHGEGCSNGLNALLHDDYSIVYGHFHTKLEIIFSKGRFAMCVGWLGDRNSPAFSYAGNTIKKQQLACGVVLNNGKIPVIISLI